jgi:hypothetical protein
MKGTEPHAPPLRRDRAARVSAAPGLLVPILALSLALCALPATVYAAEPGPDAAPQTPSVAPDPAPGGAAYPAPGATAPAPPEPTEPEQAAPVQAAPQQPAATQQPAAPAVAAPMAQPTAPTPEPKSTSKPASARRDKPTPRSERKTEPADPSLLLRVESFLPGVQGNEDSPSHLVLLAAAALLALLLASGSLLSVAARVSRGQLR